MKAMGLKKYGKPKEVLTIQEIDIPTVKENEVLIQIRATTINDYDWALTRGIPYLYRIIFGLFKPKNKILGIELSGTVEKIGSKVQGLKVGDEVFGDISDYGFGTFAQYICIDEKAVIHKPSYLSFEQAAALPHASILALQALRDLGKISKNQRVLINGGGGGVGAIGLQIAKHHHCKVTGVDSNEKFEWMKSIGYDDVIDYKKINFTKTKEQYDLILDCKTDKSAFSYMRSLKPNGKYISIGGKLTRLICIFLGGKILSFFSTKKLQILALKPNKGIDYICELCQKNIIECQIDGTYSLEDIPRLMQYFGAGKHKGKVVIKI